MKLVFLHLDKVDRALARSRLYSFNLHRPGDGNQDLVFIIMKPKDVLRELISDPRASGAQCSEYEEYIDLVVYRVFYHANGTLSFQKAQKRAGQGVSLLSII